MSKRNRPYLQRPLQDTNDEAQILYGHLARHGIITVAASDFYDEGANSSGSTPTRSSVSSATARIRSTISGARSLCSMASTTATTALTPNTFDDVVATLNLVQPHELGGSFCRARLDSTKFPAAPLDGLARGGWKFVFTDNGRPTCSVHRKIQQEHRSDGFGSAS